ncbi:membrane protein [Longispora fulva]|uniref:Putative membrane protein n=1 Tax=Longispora fulva TaxID=619741 RepID=A0A8J7G7U6_9ACTN|nr:DUF2306 domain-containing protein [Longispora fulva]MBG6134690.1 putative membrane protein [Longispora fulva]GIG61898.1 membrane protein [Longispora fulva]
MASSAKSRWLVPTLLIALTVVPMIGGAVRVADLAGNAPTTPDNARFVAMPVPVLVHIFTASVFCVLGALQFAPGLRRRGWHRIAGRITVPCGLAAALSGLWMTLFYPDAPGDGALLVGIRLVFGSAMFASLALGFAAIRRRDLIRHSAWMIRGYAIGQGAGTQVLTNVPWLLLFGVPGTVTRAMLMAAGWVINVAVAEWVIRRRPAGPRRSAMVVADSAPGHLTSQ